MLYRFPCFLTQQTYEAANFHLSEIESFFNLHNYK